MDHAVAHHPTRPKIGLVLAAIGCLGVAGYGLALAATGFRLLPDTIASNGLPGALATHIVASSVALALVPWQLSSRIRRRYLRVHRWTGRGYVVAATVGGVTGLAAGLFTSNGPIAATGFAALGVLWTGTTLTAYAAARRRDLATHRRWAIRSFALAFAAVTLRLYLPISAAAGIPFETAYSAIAWLCWVPNLLLAERSVRGVT